MATKKITLYSEKQYSLKAIRNRIKTEFDKHPLFNIEFKDEFFHELGETETLLLIFECFFFRTRSYASLVIMLSEFQGNQTADVISTGGKDELCSWGVESNFLNCGTKALKNIGFKENSI